MKKRSKGIEVPEEDMKHIYAPYSESRQAAGEGLPVSSTSCLSD
jgi:hypothetical protein